jgi:hypothetical protein
MIQTIGSGADSLVLRISQDAYRGSAQFTVRVDGTQIGGPLTAESLHRNGQSDTVTLKGDWAAGAHTVTVNFLNDAYGGTAATDRNLYVDAATYNGAAVSGAAKTLLSTGPASFGFTEAAASPTPPPPPPPPSGGPAAATVGAGSDTLTLRISQDVYREGAQYTVKVDGVQVGGVLTAQAAHGSGQSDTLTVKGDWSAGTHRVDVQFLNDAYGGTPSTDRNLYVDGAAYNGAEVSGAARTLLSAGVANFAFTEAAAPAAVQPAPAPAPAPTSGGVQTDRPLFVSFDNGLGPFTHR